MRTSIMDPIDRNGTKKYTYSSFFFFSRFIVNFLKSRRIAVVKTRLCALPFLRLIVCVCDVINKASACGRSSSLINSEAACLRIGELKFEEEGKKVLLLHKY